MALIKLKPSWQRRVAVAGHSMEPALQDGDWLLVDPAAYARRPPEPGELVVARDPRAPDRLIVKRAVLYVDGVLILAGDHPAHAQEAADIGPVRPEAIVGRPWLRYWPPRRAGLLRRHV